MNLSTVGVTMSSLEIAGLTGKSHAHVLRDADKMLRDLGIDQSKFGSVYLDGKGEERRCLNLPQRECLVLVSGYSVQMRAKIIDRWHELEVAIRSEAVGSVSNFDTEARRVIGGIVKNTTGGIVREALETLLPQMIRAELSHGIMRRTGKTAGQIWKDAGFIPLKGATVWFGHRLATLGCRVPDNGYTEMGLTKARLFDPDKANAWLANGGRDAVAKYIAERRGQGKLRLVHAA